MQFPPIVVCVPQFGGEFIRLVLEYLGRSICSAVGGILNIIYIILSFYLYLIWIKM